MHFFVFNTTYETVEIGIWHNHTYISSEIINKQMASSLLVPYADRLLTKNNLSLDQICCAIVNQGPAPFTTLRTVIASANGLGYARKISLVGVDGLQALMHETHDPAYKQTVYLLNAFNKDVYFLLHGFGNNDSSGYTNIENLLTLLHEKADKTLIIRFVGNGSLLYEKIIKTYLDNNQVFIDYHAPSCASLTAIAHDGLQLWQQCATTYQLLPLYLKDYSAPLLLPVR